MSGGFSLLCKNNVRERTQVTNTRRHFLVKVNDGNTCTLYKTSEICLVYPGVLLVNFEQISHINLVFQLLTLSK